MSKILWRDAVEIIKPHVVKISTPRGSGTGFLCAYTKDKTLCGIATAAHVIEDAHIWEEPIRIQHYNSKETELLHAGERAIWLDTVLDTAVIVFSKKKFSFPEITLSFISETKHLKVGEEIGWVGFPSMSPHNLCFFTGTNSCWLNDSRTYLVDGVAINGVSGGPAFCSLDNKIKVIGSVTAYLPNRSGSTPGLAMISDVDQFLSVIKEIKDWEEAKEKETPPTEVKDPIPDKTNQGEGELKVRG